MGGIVGAYGYYNQQPVQEGLIPKMTRVLKHRGPDEEGEYHDRELALGYRHLNTTGRESGKGGQSLNIRGQQQPQFNEDRSKVLVLDGEIYNYRELRQRLEEKGHYFQTDSDAETILHLYEEKGVNFLDDLRGVFSLALWDKRTKSLLLARDRLGVKPLYYYSDGYRLIFASEMKAIFQDKTVAKELNPHAVADYFSYLYIPAPKTIFLGIYKLPPGYYLLCSPERYIVKKYWDIELCSGPEEESLERYQDTLLNLLQESIAGQLPADTQALTGLFLSGGIDSATLLALCHRLGVSLQGHTIGFEGSPEFDERPFARILARHFELPCQEWVLSPKGKGMGMGGMLEQLDRLAKVYDEPLGDPTIVLSYELARLSSQNTRVALSGEMVEAASSSLNGGMGSGMGSGSGFHPLKWWNGKWWNGNLSHRALQYCEPHTMATSGFHCRHLWPGLNLWKNCFRQYLFKAATHPHNASGKAGVPRFCEMPFLFSGCGYSAREYIDSMSCFSAEGIKRLLGEDFSYDLRGYDPSMLFQDLYRKTIDLDPFSRMQYIGMKTYLPDNVLARIDRASMANSLQVRFPLLDHRLVEFLSHVPVHFKVKGTEEKYLLRKAMEGVLPPAILSRKKQKAGLPLQNWLLGEWRLEGEKYLRNQQLSSLSEVLNFNEISSLWQRHQQRRKDYSRQIWAVLFFQRWYHQHLSRSRAREEDLAMAMC